MKKVTTERLQSRSTAFQRHRKKKRRGPNNDKTITDLGIEPAHDITKTRLFKYIENFTSKNLKFSDKKKTKKLWYFSISAQNIDCGYSLEPPRQSDSNEYSQCMFLSRNKKNNVYPCKPQFYYIKVESKGVKII